MVMESCSLCFEMVVTLDRTRFRGEGGVSWWEGCTLRGGGVSWRGDGSCGGGGRRARGLLVLNAAGIPALFRDMIIQLWIPNYCGRRVFVILTDIVCLTHSLLPAHLAKVVAVFTVGIPDGDLSWLPGHGEQLWRAFGAHFMSPLAKGSA